MRRNLSKLHNSICSFKSISTRFISTGACVDDTYPLAKIVATIGPASEQNPTLSRVVNAGMRIMRINFSHATYDEANLRMTNLRSSPGRSGPRNVRAVMLDTQGPEIRTGSFPGNEKEITFNEGDMVTLTTDPSVRENQTNSKLWVSYGKLTSTVFEGSTILLDDGAIILHVKTILADSGNIECTVQNTGVLGNRKGVNLPGMKVDLPAMSNKDKEDIAWGLKNDIDYIAASFVRKAKDVQDIRDYTRSLVKKIYPDVPDYPLPLVISKIESTEALENFDSILDESDAIMVARGDLAVEIPMESLAFVQKQIVKKSNMKGKPVIVATQMLETMQKNPRPTRAECTDVANAVIDGADCVMLSGESAKGKYPIEAVSMMDSIIRKTEDSIRNPAKWMNGGNSDNCYTATKELGKKQSMAYAAVTCSKVIKDSDKAALILVVNDTDMCKYISQYRPHVPVVGLFNSHKMGRFMQLYYAVHPVVVDLQDIYIGSQLNLEYIKTHMSHMGLLDKSSRQNIMVLENDSHFSVASV